MAFTHLSPAALPGRTYSFSPKAEATGEKPSDRVTSLSPLALPGPIYSFLPKDAAEAAKGEGLFTWLSPVAIPGMRYSFLPKDAAAIIEAKTRQGRRHIKRQIMMGPQYRDRILREDQELMEFISIILETELLN